MLFGQHFILSVYFHRLVIVFLSPTVVSFSKGTAAELQNQKPFLAIGVNTS